MRVAGIGLLTVSSGIKAATSTNKRIGQAWGQPVYRLSLKNSCRSIFVNSCYESYHPLVRLLFETSVAQKQLSVYFRIVESSINLAEIGWIYKFFGNSGAMAYFNVQLITICAVAKSKCAMFCAVVAPA